MTGVLAITFNQFVDYYKDNLNLHLAKYEDNCELTFLDDQLFLYTQNISVCEYNLYENSHLDQKQTENLEELKNFIEENLLLYYRDHAEISDLELWDRLHVSSYKIVQFIEQRKQEIEEDLELKMTKRQEVPALEIRQKSNKSLMFEGKNLNIKDRYRILNKVLDFDKKVHPLNIGELQKYQLLAYILGCDKDNARKLMCGSHDAKDNDLTAYFNDLGLNK